MSAYWPFVATLLAAAAAAAPPTIDTGAKHAIVVDFNTGAVLFDKGARRAHSARVDDAR